MKSVFTWTSTSTSEVILLDAEPLPRVIQVAALAVVDVERRLVPALILRYFLGLLRSLKNTSGVADPILVIPGAGTVPRDGGRHPTKFLILKGYHGQK